MKAHADFLTSICVMQDGNEPNSDWLKITNEKKLEKLATYRREIANHLKGKIVMIKFKYKAIKLSGFLCLFLHLLRAYDQLG